MKCFVVFLSCWCLSSKAPFYPLFGGCLVVVVVYMHVRPRELALGEVGVSVMEKALVGTSSLVLALRRTLDAVCLLVGALVHVSLLSLLMSILVLLEILLLVKLAADVSLLEVVIRENHLQGSEHVVEGAFLVQVFKLDFNEGISAFSYHRIEIVLLFGKFPIL